ncbi:MAG: hypothetical protein U9R42_10785 [Bacteroidota bacterium]|nr:hypothetical protein [Bacteroidota bacterium]
MLFVFPKGGIKLSEDFSIKLPTFENIFNPKKVEYADISNIISNTDSLITEPEKEKKIDTLRADANDLITNVYKIQYPNGEKEILYPFFRELKNLKSSGKLIRILHYGDSQIEGDRITSYLRFKFQNMFGGSGAGMLPILNVTKSISLNVNASDEWKKYTVIGKKDSTLNHKRYGALLNFARFSPVSNDSILNDSINYEALITLKKSNLTYYNTRQFNQLRLFYGYNKQAFTIELFDKEEKLIRKDSLEARNSATTISWKFEKTPELLTLKLKGKDSPDFYGIAVDNTYGVAVDNIPLRGSAGLDFAKTDLVFLSKMYRYLEVKLLVLEFGVNVVPNVVDNYDYYERWFYNNLRALKRINPEISIIVIGLSDMARKTESGNYYESYPNIGLIRDAQKKAAFKAGCGFWDLYEAMGGKNSMPSWVFAKPPLAAKDFTHFNHKGAKIISQMFFNALITDYKEFANQ